MHAQPVLAIATAMADWHAGARQQARERLQVIKAALSESRESVDPRNQGLLRQAIELMHATD